MTCATLTAPVAQLVDAIRNAAARMLPEAFVGCVFGCGFDPRPAHEPFL